MSKSRRPFATGDGEREDAWEDFTIERGINAIDQLREKMRLEGMVDCADALDEVFILCLRAYVTRDDPQSESRPQPTKIKKAGDNLN